MRFERRPYARHAVGGAVITRSYGRNHAERAMPKAEEELRHFEGGAPIIKADARVTGILPIYISVDVRRAFKEPVETWPVDVADQHQTFDAAFDQETGLMFFLSQIVLRCCDEQRISLIGQTSLERFDQPA